MATKNPRISVMLKPETDAVLTRLSAATKQSKSSIIAEFLEDACMPMFERMVVVLEAAANATDEAKAATRQGFADAEEKLLGVMGMTTDLFDVAAQPILLDAEKATGQTGRGRRAAARATGLEPARPPHVTRGSGTPNKSAKTAISPMKTGSGKASQKKVDLEVTKWWKGLSERQRSYWLSFAGTDIPAEAYTAYIQSIAAPTDDIPSKRIKRPSKALKPKVGG